MSRYIIEAEDVRMLNGVADCVASYQETDNKNWVGINSVAIYRINDGREYIVQMSKLKSGTTKVFAYQDTKSALNIGDK